MSALDDLLNLYEGDSKADRADTDALHATISKQARKLDEAREIISNMAHRAEVRGDTSAAFMGHEWLAENTKEE